MNNTIKHLDNGDFEVLPLKSQNFEILNHLREGKGISQLTAAKQFNCYRLGARIYDLKNGSFDGINWPIQTEMVSHGGKRFARYVLDENWETKI